MRNLHKKTAISLLALSLSACATSPSVENLTPLPNSPPQGHVFNDPRLKLESSLIEQIDAANLAGGRGQFKAEMVSDNSLATHTIYRPKNYQNLNFKLPIVAWANGACGNAGNRFQSFLTDVSSHGFLIIAIGPIVPQPTYPEIAAGQPLPRGGPEATPPQSDYTQMFDAINWAIAQNSNPNSPYYNKIDIEKIAVAGQSCGGLQTISAAADPRVKTALVLNSGIRQGRPALTGTGNALKESLSHLHTSILYLSGDENDVAFYNANSDFNDINNLPIARVYEIGKSHGGTYREINGGDFAIVTAAWLGWQLNNNNDDKKWFFGTNCRLCNDSKWVIRTKNLR